ncbi:MAG: type II toxin-antitoxin system PemK/MazF family toxin [Dysgonamonadaceae bacterium]|jgi:mRNA interferase MazF|nr:type II toxin-antitoxin system PemK/MazF family toxin [Dysgonamonadaceae bacterium]
MKQGEIWLIDLNPTIGAEMQKIRPALIVNVDALGKLPLKIIVPVTDWKERLIKKIGYLSFVEMEEIKSKIAQVIGL